MSLIDDLLAEARGHIDARRFDRAEELFRRALLGAPAHFEALCLLGVALQQRGALDEAEECYAKAVAAQPQSAAAWFARGAVLRQLTRDDDAAASFRKTLALDSNHLGACLQLGNLVFARDAEAGLELFERALAIDPAHAGAKTCATLAHVAMGARYSAEGRWPDMFAAYQRALDLDPAHAGAHFNLAVELLRHGRLLDGWPEYEWRWRWKGFGDRPRSFPQPQWRGEPLNGASILLHSEQGLGDALQFARYAPHVAERGGLVFLETPRELVRVMKSLDGIAGIVTRGDSLPPVDWHCPLMSLPLAFETSLDTIPASVPYLRAAASALPDSPLAPKDAACRVGLVWAGSPAHLRDERRSIALELFAPLTTIPGTVWYSLQKGAPAARLSDPPAGLAIVDLGPLIHDFADTAAYVSALDLVITVDTSVAHLAGALGKPVWILVPTPSDWRWLLGRDDSPWYPTARLFRQLGRGKDAWGPVVERVHRELLSAQGR